MTMSLYLQSVEGASPVHAGLQITALAVGTTVMSPIAGALTTRVSTRTLTTVSTLGTAAVLTMLGLHIAGPAQSVPIVVILFLLGSPVASSRRPTRRDQRGCARRPIGHGQRSSRVSGQHGGDSQHRARAGPGCLCNSACSARGGVFR
ncbi:hypothetical protein NY08_6 [Rhodococcus sp. B7740]|nr:hypothetical protein NY08_6 [Rhodococcus sp. B7740]